MSINFNGVFNTSPSEFSLNSPRENELPNGSQSKVNEKLVISQETNCSASTSRYGRIIKSTSSMRKLSLSLKGLQTPKNENPSVSENENESVVSSNNYSIECNSERDVSSNMSDIITNNESAVAEKTKDSYIIGQLAWGRVGRFPFWPCVVTPEPETNVHERVQTYGKKIRRHVHVHYFGDKGRHGWVSRFQMIPFTGKEDDFKTIERLSIVKPKRPVSKKHISIPMSQAVKIKWEIAIREATQLLPCTNEERVDFFKPKPKSSKKMKNVFSGILNIDDDTKGKRKLSHNNDEPVLKKIKQDLDNSQQSQNNGVMGSVIGYGKKRKKSGNSEYESDTEKDMVSNEKDKSVSEKNSTTETKLSLTKNVNGMLSLQRKSSKYFKQKGDEQPKESNSSSDAESTDIDLGKDVKKQKAEKSKSEKEDSTTPENNKRVRLYNPFRGFKLERVCQICEKTGELIRCKGPCYSYFHLSCVRPDESSPNNSIQEDVVENGIMEDLKIIKEKMVEDEESDCNDNRTEGKEEDETFKCIDCLSGVAPACFICNEREGDRIRCGAWACGKHYHTACLKTWPQSHWQGGRLTCPYHVCHTCSSDNPQNSHSIRPVYEKLARCVRCPSSYHPSVSCLPAGSTVLTGSQIICPKHYKADHPPVNATWCFLCTKGGSLICCDTCPMSFHADCLSIKTPDGAYICEDCETGRLPLYGEIVWVKLGKYRWWPSIVCYPNEIPQNVDTMPHTPGEFCIMFLGSNNYYWVHRGRVFLYQDGDASVKAASDKRLMKTAYKRALRVAHKMHQEFKAKRDAIKDLELPRNLRPPHYVRLKMNRPVGNVKPVEKSSIVACQCTLKMEKPCAPDANCLNRMLLVECSPDICPAGTKCNNQDFVQRRYPAMKPFHTDGRGWGLRTLVPIRSGQFVIEYVGEIIDEAEYKRRLQRKKEMKNENYYFLTIDNNRMIDAEPKGNLSRFMNHSCQPNCETQKWTVNGDTRIGLFALRDIQVGEELTFNYHLRCDGEWRKPCLCGAPNCSGFIGLKSVRASVNGNQPKKIEKDDEKKKKEEKKTEKVKQKKRGRKSKKVEASSTENCWACGEILLNADSTVTCNRKMCLKVYHESCVVVEDTTKFYCPWHYCSDCNRKTSFRCSLCSRAFCQVHIDGNLIENNDNGQYICSKHEQPTDSNTVKRATDADIGMDQTSHTDLSSMDELDNSLPKVTVEEVRRKQR